MHTVLAFLSLWQMPERAPLQDRGVVLTRVSGHVYLPLSLWACDKEEPSPQRGAVRTKCLLHGGQDADRDRQTQKERERESQSEREKMSDACSSEWASFFFLFISGGL